MTELEDDFVDNPAARAAARWSALGSPGVTTLADVSPEHVAWLWPGRIPLGKLTVIDGDPSTGKSTLTLDLAARVTTGADWPDGTPGSRPGGVLLLSAEDGAGDTIRPRLDAAGANPARVHLLEAVPLVGDDNTVRMVFPSVPRDVEHVEAVVRRHRVRLVVVDVLMAYLTGDSHKDQEVRSALAPLAAMAERTGCAVIVIRHLNKSGGSNALYRGGGSIGIVGAARAAYLVARDGEDPARRIFAVTKLNIAIEPPAMAYRLVSDPIRGVARVEWEPDALTDVTASSLLRLADDEQETERDDCAAWLVDHLLGDGGEGRPDDVLKAGRIAGWSVDQIKRSKRRAGVSSVKSGMGGGWVWRLDEHTKGAPKGAKGAPSGELHSSLPSVLPSAAPSCGDDSCPRCGEPLIGPAGMVACEPKHAAPHSDFLGALTRSSS